MTSFTRVEGCIFPTHDRRQRRGAADAKLEMVPPRRESNRRRHGPPDLKVAPQPVTLDYSRVVAYCLPKIDGKYAVTHDRMKGDFSRTIFTFGRRYPNCSDLQQIKPAAPRHCEHLARHRDGSLPGLACASGNRGGETTGEFGLWHPTICDPVTDIHPDPELEYPCQPGNESLLLWLSAGQSAGLKGRHARHSGTLPGKGSRFCSPCSNAGLGPHETQSPVVLLS